MGGAARSAMGSVAHEPASSTIHDQRESPRSLSGGRLSSRPHGAAFPAVLYQALYRAQNAPERPGRSR